jgi:tRNA-Thr(GGU) m(6)t(6)A37 methyltransferase TsaA
MEIVYRPIGIIRTPFKSKEGVPIQPVYGKGVKGYVEVFPEYVEGLKDLEGFSHLILVYHFHLSNGYKLLVKPYLDENLRGVFSTRAPRRPNPIGISIVRLIERVGSTLHISDVDMVDGTPLLDIKPYIPDFDNRTDVKIGWLERGLRESKRKISDGRF